MGMAQNDPFSAAFELVLEYNQAEESPEIDVTEWMASEACSDSSAYGSMCSGTTPVESTVVTPETEQANALAVQVINSEGELADDEMSSKASDER